MFKSCLFGLIVLAVTATHVSIANGAAQRPAKILFLGNSITAHPPAPGTGWDGDNWGMAASSKDKDYVHLLAAKLADGSSEKPAVMVTNIADFERGYNTYDIAARLKDELTFEAPLVVLAIGENVAALNTDEAKSQFRTRVDKLLAEIAKHGKPRIIVRSCFWPDPAKDEVLKAAADAAGATFVDISELGKDGSNAARAERKFTHDDVAGHPGDKGMQAIADALWVAIQKASKATK